MSFSALYEYMHGEFQDVTRVPLAAAGVDPAWIIDPNGVKIAGYQIELWDAETGGTRLLEGVDYSLVFLDSGKTAAEGIDIWAGYQVINVAYQGIPLYLTARIIGGYTKHNGGIIEEYELDGQYVTKWDTGRLEIRIFKSLTFTITVADGGLFRNDTASSETLVALNETFIDIDGMVPLPSTATFTDRIVSIRSNYLTTTSIKFLAFSTSALTQAVFIRCLIIGRWK